MNAKSTPEEQKGITGSGQVEKPGYIYCPFLDKDCIKDICKLWVVVDCYQDTQKNYKQIYDCAFTRK